jgi:CHASE3 domain sensor protein
LIGAEFLKAYNIQTTDAILEKINHASDEGQELMDAYKQYSEFYNSIEKRNDRPALDEDEDENEQEQEVADVNS